MFWKKKPKPQRVVTFGGTLRMVTNTNPQPQINPWRQLWQALLAVIGLGASCKTD